MLEPENSILILFAFKWFTAVLATVLVLYVLWSGCWLFSRQVTVVVARFSSTVLSLSLLQSVCIVCEMVHYFLFFRSVSRFGFKYKCVMPLH